MIMTIFFNPHDMFINMSLRPTVVAKSEQKLSGIGNALNFTSIVSNLT